MAGRDTKLPKFALIKQYVQGQIESADWPVGTCIPSETELATTFNVSRMTARRALQELADQGLLSRVPGRGSFVAKPEAPAAQLEIYNQLHSAQAAGTYSNRILSLESTAASVKVAELLHLGSGDVVYQLTMVHLDRDKPVQWQQLHINPLMAPALLKQKFNKISPDDYLQWLAPSTSNQHQLTAISASPSQRLELELSVDEASACLQLARRCWHKQNVRSFSLSLYPASAYSLGANLLDLDTKL